MAEEKRNIMTEEGLRKLQEQLDYLVGVRRNEVAHKIEVARGFGDLSENAEYDEAKKEQGQLEDEIARLTKVISTAVVVSDSEISTDKVSVGVTVKLEDVNTGDVFEYAIVGAEEADPYEDKISNESPVGAALMGATVGSVLDIEVPMGMLKYKVLEIKREGNGFAYGDQREALPPFGNPPPKGAALGNPAKGLRPFRNPFLYSCLAVQM